MRIITIILAALLTIAAASPAFARWQCISAMDMAEGTATCDEYYADLRMYYGYVLTDEGLFRRLEWDRMLALTLLAVDRVVADFNSQGHADSSVAPDRVP